MGKCAIMKDNYEMGKWAIMKTIYEVIYGQE